MTEPTPAPSVPVPVPRKRRHRKAAIVPSVPVQAAEVVNAMSEGEASTFACHLSPPTLRSLMVVVASEYERRRATVAAEWEFPLPPQAGA